MSGRAVVSRRAAWLALTAAGVACNASAAGYHLLKRIPVPGDYGWDYASSDSANRRLYVGHDEEVVVIDLDTDTIVGSVGGGADMHGASVAPELGRGFISESNPGEVIIFDLKTLERLGEVTVGKDPNLILYDPSTGLVFSADRGDQRVSAIDARTGKLVGAVGNLNGRTEHGAADGKGHLFLNLQDKGLLLKIDAEKLTVLNTWSVAPCGQPSAMDMDKQHERVFIGCRSGAFAAVDGDTGRVITTLPIGPGVDALEFDAAKGLIYVSSGGDGGSLAIFHEDAPDQYSLVERVATQANARTLAVDHKTGHVYLPVGKFGPAPAGERRGPLIPGSFEVLVFGE
jgi:DNA-binding beta-propeller fold protein YncE